MNLDSWIAAKTREAAAAAEPMDEREAQATPLVRVPINLLAQAERFTASESPQLRHVFVSRRAGRRGDPSQVQIAASNGCCAMVSRFQEINDLDHIRPDVTVLVSPEQHERVPNIAQTLDKELARSGISVCLRLCYLLKVVRLFQRLGYDRVHLNVLDPERPVFLDALGDCEGDQTIAAVMPIVAGDA